MSIKEIVESITRDRGQSMQEVVWDMILRDQHNSFVTVLSELESIDKYRPEDRLASHFSREVISQLVKYRNEG